MTKPYTRYVHHDPNAAEAPGAGFPTYEELVAENAKLRAMLDEVEEWLDDRADADCDQDGYIPNDEMRLLTTVRTVLHGSNAP